MTNFSCLLAGAECNRIRTPLEFTWDRIAKVNELYTAEKTTTGLANLDTTRIAGCR
jgi:hypothetical protein